MSQSLFSLPHDIPSDIQELLLQQIQSWQQGTRPPIETIIEQAKPENRTIAVQVLIKQEIDLREKAGETPQIDEYLSRFPECADRLSGQPDNEHDLTMATELGEIRSVPEQKDRDQSFENTFADHFPPHPSVFYESNTQSDVPSAPLSSSQFTPRSGAQAAPQVGAQAPAPHREVGFESASQLSNTNSNLVRPRDLGQADPSSRMIGMYRLDKKLGQGGMGAVFRAVHTKLDKVVAIKVMSRHGMLDNTAVERFEREMRAVGRIEHPNVVRAMDAGEADGYHYLVMEYVEGQDVSQLVKANGPFSIAHACEIIRQSALGLHEAHALGLVHRDIKPSNLFLTTKGVVKILDLGLARLSESQATNHELITQSGLCMGTPDYMAPEQWVSARDVDGRSDFYALGCTLYHLIVGHPPFGTKENLSLGNKVLAHTSGIVPDIRLLCSNFPEGLKPVLDRMLAKDRNKRYETGVEMAEALEPFCVPLPGAEEVSASEVALPRPNANTPNPPNFRKLTTAFAYWGGGLALLAVTAFIIIRVTDPNGRVTELHVPSGSTIMVGQVDPNDSTSKPAKSRAKPDKSRAKPDSAKPEIAKADGAGAKPDTSLVKAGLQNGADTVIGTGPKPNATTNQPNDVATSNDGDSPKTQDKKVAASGVEGDSGTDPIGPVTPTVAATNPTTPDHPEVTGEPSDMPPKVTIVALNPAVNPGTLVPKIIPAVFLKLPSESDTIADQQAAWSRELKRPTTKSNTIGMPFVLIPPGEFDMGGRSTIPGNGATETGTSQSRAAEFPRHHVKISRPFALGQHEVTVAQFRQFVAATHYKTIAERETATGRALSEGLKQKQRQRLPIFSWQFTGELPVDENQPVTNISWYDAVAFCEWLSQKEGLTYRLPTEAEWEYSVRAGNGAITDGSKESLELIRQEANISDASGSRAFGEIGVVSQAEAANWDDEFPAQAPVGQFAANALGLHDLSGNVAEWCGDRFGAEYYATSPLENPRGPLNGSSRVVRGASWQSPTVDCRPEFRSDAVPNQAQLNVGFRVVQELQPAAENLKLSGSQVERELAIARWVLHAGGKVRVSINGTPGIETAKLADLTSLALAPTFSLYAVSLADTGISDLALVRLKPLIGLQELDLSGNPIQDAALAHLVSCRMLKKLNLSRTQVTGPGLIHLGVNKKLADLNLSYCRVTDTSISTIKVLTSLTALRLDSTAITDATLELLKPLTLLKDLSLVDTRVTGSGLVHLKKLAGLTSLDLSETPLIDKSLSGLANLKTLRQLRLNWSTVSELGLEHLKDAYTLLEIELRGTSTADSNIDILQKLKAIQKLDLRETDFSESGVKTLKQALNRAAISASIGDVNARVASLCLSVGGKLVIAPNSDAEPQSITQLEALPTGQFEIREIDLTDLPVSDGILLMVPRLRSLKVLNLSGTRVDNEGVALLATSLKLESLNLSGTLVTAEGLSRLNEIKTLKSLTLRETRLPGDKITELRETLPGVQIQ